MTEQIYRDDAYERQCEAKILEVNDRGGIILDRTVFYATGGGQPGDNGVLDVPGIGEITIATAVYGDSPGQIVHVTPEGSELPKAGDSALCRLDWDRRYAHMRMHTCLHLLCTLLPYPVTGGQIGQESSRLDFDIQDASLADKEQLTEELNQFVAADHPVSERWITDAELEANPDLVRTMAVKPPMGSGRVRLVEIGGGAVDLQPCGGTHVRTTSEIGAVTVQKIEKKGRMNRRVRIAFAD
jgi:misacylated tRNA(Ala) deacylase